MIQDDPYSPFPQIAYTERPDRVVATLLQGRVCIFTDGTPMVLIIPATFGDLIQSPEERVAVPAPFETGALKGVPFLTASGSCPWRRPASSSLHITRLS